MRFGSALAPARESAAPAFTIPGNARAPDRMVGALCVVRVSISADAVVGQRRLAEGTTSGLAVPAFSDLAVLAGRGAG